MASNSRNLSKLANKLDVAANYDLEFITNLEVKSIGVGTPGSNTTGEIRATNEITGFYSSDRNFKENIKDIDGALNIVIHVGGKTFDWNDAYIEKRGGEDGYFVKREDFGVIAQDIQEVFPLAVREREDGSLAVDYNKLIAVAFAAIKEQQTIIEKHEALINTLLAQK